MDYGIPLIIQKNIEVKGKRVGDYFYDEAEDTIYYDLPYCFPCKFAVKGLKEIVVTPWMLRLPSFLKYHNIDWLRQQLMQVKCIQDGAVMLHGAAWFADNTGFLAVGFCNSGKTTRVLREVKKGAVFCADENVIVTVDDKLVPVIRPTSLSWHLAKELGAEFDRWQEIAFLIARIKAKILPIFEPNIWVQLPFQRFGFKLNKIIFLQEGKGQSLLLLTDNEFPFYTNPVIQTYAYASGFDLDGLYKKYRDNLKRMDKCFRS